MPQLLICYCKIGRKRIIQGTLWPHDFITDIQEVIDPKKSIIRYGRTWRFSHPKTEKEHLLGKLGYITSGIETKPYYDEEKQDFI